MVTQGPEANGIDWIDELSDEQCMEIFWLYVNLPEPFLEAHRPELLGQAMRFALREVAKSLGESGTPRS
jgi:hypothetical protein